MTDKAISPLRQRMIEDMTARHFAEKVQTDYIRHVKNFVAFLGRSPDTATSEDLRLYQLHMMKSRVSPPSINAAILALRFFFRVYWKSSGRFWGVKAVGACRRGP